MKVICDGCGWHGKKEEMLSAKNPFSETEVIFACPKCKLLENSVERACDIDGCWEEAVSGQPTSDGYKLLCGKHLHSRVEREGTE